MSSIGLTLNAYREENALPGLMENASKFFDEIVMISAPPENAYENNNDETIAIAEKWGAKIVHSTIEKGFGYVRTQCIRESSCEWVVIMDADERIHWNAFQLDCTGEESWNPDTCPEPNLIVDKVGGYDQADLLRNMVKAADDNNVDAIQFMRRHWFDFGFENPTQNWLITPDWQLRCVRNKDTISYTRGMHEGIVDSETGAMPRFTSLPPDQKVGLFFDHYHLHFKKMEVEQRQEDIATYNRLHERIDKADGPQEPGTLTQDHKG